MALISLVGTLEGEPGGELGMAHKVLQSRQNAVQKLKRGRIDGVGRGFQAYLFRQVVDQSRYMSISVDGGKMCRGL